MEKGKDFIGITIVYLCHDGNGNFLLNKRSENCRDEHHTWDPGGGALEFGDTIEETLKRELIEEYGVEPLECKFLGYRDVRREKNGVKTHWVALDFKIKVDRNKVKNGEPHKFEEIGWFKLDNLPSPLHSQFGKFLEIHKEKI